MTTPDEARTKLTPHQRIMRAAKARKGLRLSADEVWRLSQDDAIRTCATNDDERMKDPEIYDAEETLDYAITASDRERARRRLAALTDEARQGRKGTDANSR